MESLGFKGFKGGFLDVLPCSALWRLGEGPGSPGVAGFGAGGPPMTLFRAVFGLLFEASSAPWCVAAPVRGRSVASWLQPLHPTACRSAGSYWAA